MNGQKKSAFTLVELIIVITILVILATIAFVSFQNYVRDSRDSNRLATLKNIETGLQVFQVKSGAYPDPDKIISITASGTPITKQGFFDARQSHLISLNNIPRDPKENIAYIYATTQNNSSYQLLGYLENQYASMVSHTYANDYSQRIPKVVGEKVGILLHENNSFPTVGHIDTFSGTTNYKIIFDSTQSITASGNNIFTNIYNRRDDLLNNNDIAQFDNSLVGYWDMETTTTSGGLTVLKDFSKYKNNGNLHGGISIGNTNSVGEKSKGTFFDGTNDYINVGKIFSGVVKEFTTNFIVQYKTINQRVTCGADPNIFSPILSSWNSYNGGTNEQGIRFGVNNNCNGNTEFSYSIGDSNSGGRSVYNTTPHNIFLKNHLNNFYFMSITFKSGKIHIYINGEKVNTSTLLIPYLYDGRDDLFIGKTLVNYGPFHGILDDIRIYNRALSDKEVQTLYKNTQ